MNKKLQFKSLILLVALLLGGAGSAWAEGSLISSLSDISEGTYYIAALNDTKYYTVPSTTINGQTFTCVESSVSSEGILTPATGSGEFVFTAVSGVDNAFYIYNKSLKKYLVATGSKTFGYVENSNNDYGYWTFSTVSSGGFSGVFSVQHSNKSHYLRAYNNSVRCYDGANNNGVYLFKKIESASTVESPTFTPTAGAYTSAQSVSLSCETTGATIYYTTDGSDPTSSSTKYTSPINVSSTTTIKAIAINGDNKSQIVSAVYAIMEHAGTAADPYSVADARAAIDVNMGITDVYATGKVSGIVEEYSEQHKNITFNISTDGLTTSPQLQAYRCQKGEGTNNPDVNNIKVGDVVVIKGNLIIYNSTYEFAQGNILISLASASVATPTFTPTTGTFTIAQSVTIECATEGASIYYTKGDNPDDPTNGSTLYEGPIAVNATTTIKAIATKGTNTSEVATATYSFATFEHAGTDADPFTVANARAAIDANVCNEVYATGTVSKIVTEYNETYSNISFNISANGLEEGDQLLAYRCKGATGIDVSGVKVGDVVLVKGILKKHNSTYEFGEGCELISLQHPVTPIIAATPTSLTEFTYEVGKEPSEAQTFSVTGENLTGNITLSLGESSNYEMSFSEENGYGNSLTISQTKGSVEAKIVYVRLKGNLEENDSYSGTITIASTGATSKSVSLTGSVIAPEAPNMTWDLSKKTYNEITDVDIVTWPSDYATMMISSKGVSTTVASNYLGEDANNRTSSRFYLDNTLTIVPANGYAITSIEFTATSENYASVLANSTWSNAEAAATTVNNKYYVTVTPTNGSKTISAIIGNTCGFTAVKVYYEENTSTVNNVKVTIPNSKYTTFASSSAISFDGTDINVCIAKVEDGVVKVTRIRGNIVPANTGVILYAETPGEYTGVVTTSGPDVSDNELVASLSTTKVSYKAGKSPNYKYNYILQEGVFKKATGANLHAGKAFLSTTYNVAATSARELQIVFEGEEEATGIADVKSQKEEGGFFNLSGQRVTKPTKGLYIMNGKKMIVK